MVIDDGHWDHRGAGVTIKV
ncbi:hypothetical protein D034_1577A, partial [Vibrio parahaemolyticus Peru-288]